jgi:hypothetical protein|tara:strand:- start:3442 stop:3669 length:228 start_codon:yes stop_codon:yes gene_type:complete
MVYYDEVQITGKSVNFYKERKNSVKTTKDEHEVLSVNLKVMTTSKDLDRILEVLQDITTDDYVEFDVTAKITNNY